MEELPLPPPVETTSSDLPQRPRRMRTIVLTVGGLVLSVVFALLTFASVHLEHGHLHFEPRMDRAALARALELTDPWTALAFVGLTILTLPLRAWQWGMIVRPPGRFRDRYHATAIGFLAVNLLPARLGEVTRGLVLAGRVPGLSRVQAVGSVLFSRVFDLLALWILCLPLPWLLTFDPARRTACWLGFAVLTALCIAALGLVWAARRHGPALTAWLERRGSTRLAPLFGRFCEGFGPEVSLTMLARALAAAVIFQLVSALAYVPVLMRLAGGVPPWSGAIFGLTALSLGLVIPSSPSGIGIYHFALAFALRAIGGAPAAAAAVAIVTHLGSLVAFVVAGLASMVVGGSSASHARPPSAQAPA